MNPWLLGALGLVAIAVGLLWPRLRLRAALRRPFPDAWEAFLHQNLPVYQQLSTQEQHQLRQHTKQFLHEKLFSGAGGLEINDEIRVTIAASACLLVLKRASVFPGLRYIVVYPSTFVVNRAQADQAGVVGPGERTLLGESWQSGKVILAWDSVLGGARNFEDGHNVVLHEFAHQLDSETGSANGAPLLGGASSYAAWAAVLAPEFHALQEDERRGRRSLIDHYGATNPAEFFAVATETFFEQPAAMAREHQALYAALERYYRVDPRHWHAQG